ncbi:MAG: polymer-forming cytoskeletal protein [Acidobacteria bacterium]|nr:polymer-forming cytoskeletal protein [Acidobacteriota bacterium]
MARRQRGEPEEAGFSQVGRSTLLSGRLAGEGVLLVSGELAGELQLRGELIVAPGGEVRARRAVARSLRVEGAAEGSFEIAGSVVVSSGAVLFGSVAAERLEVGPGGRADVLVRVRPQPAPTAPSRD